MLVNKIQHIQWADLALRQESDDPGAFVSEPKATGLAEIVDPKTF